MYDHILEMVREVYWMYGNVTSAGYPLSDVDTISRTGDINMNSALYLIVKEVGWFLRFYILCPSKA